jgi:hypothetical protein
MIDTFYVQLDSLVDESNPLCIEVVSQFMCPSPGYQYHHIYWMPFVKHARTHGYMLMGGMSESEGVAEAFPRSHSQPHWQCHPG